MDVVRHNYPWPELIVSQGLAAEQRFGHGQGYSLAAQPGTGAVNVAIDPREFSAARYLVSGSEVALREAAVQMPSEKQPGVFGVNVRKTALALHASNSGPIAVEISRSHERERGTHECVRHALVSYD